MLADFLRTDPRPRQAHTSQIAVSEPFRAIVLLRDPAKVDSLNRSSQSHETDPNFCERVLQHRQQQRQGFDGLP